MLRSAPLSLFFGLLVAAPACTLKDDDGSGSGDGSDGGSGGTAAGAPVANAGQDQTLTFSGAVSLDGTGSYDPDGDELTYTWAFDHVPEGSALAGTSGTVSPNNTTGASRPTFVPDLVGTYVIALTVSDGENTSAPDYVVITIEESESLPVADAGIDQSVKVGDAATLDGSRSYDLDGLSLTYLWTVVDAPEGSGVNDGALSDVAAVNPSFTADMKGAYTLNLTVNNGLAASLPDAVSVTAVGTDREPVANAGSDISAYDCSFIQLDASASSDPDGDALSYFWEVQGKPAGSTVDEGSFSDRTAADPTFYADIAGTYQVSVAVSDGTHWSTPDSITIEVSERTYNTAPIVSFTPIPSIAGGSVECEESGYAYDCDECSDQTLTLDSYVTVTDPDGDPYTLQWEITVGNATITDPNAIDTTFVLEDIEATEPDVCDVNEFDAVLKATDCTGAVGSAIAVMRVECCGTWPASDTGKKGK